LDRKLALLRASMLQRFDFFSAAVLGLRLKPFHLDWIQFQLNNHRSLFLGPRGSWKCVSPDTLIATKSGLKPICDLEEGDELVSPLSRETPNVVQFVASFQDTLYRVEFNDGSHIDCTYDEKFAAFRGGKIEFVPLIELRLGEKVLGYNLSPDDFDYSFRSFSTGKLSLKAYFEVLAYLFLFGPDKSMLERRFDTYHSLKPRFKKIFGRFDGPALVKFYQDEFVNGLPKKVLSAHPELCRSFFLTVFILRRKSGCFTSSDLFRPGVFRKFSTLTSLLGFSSELDRETWLPHSKGERELFLHYLYGVSFERIRSMLRDSSAVLLEFTDWVDLAEEVGRILRTDSRIPLVLRIHEGYRFYRSWKQDLLEYPLDWEQEAIREEARQFVHEFLPVLPDTSSVKFEVKKLEPPFFFKKIKEVRRFRSDSEVFDIQTSHGVYIANSVVVHNSTILDVGFSLWSALRDPNIRIAIVSKTSDKSSGFVSKIKGLCEKNKWLRLLFRDKVHPASAERWTQSALTFNRTEIFPEPTISALGVGTSLGGSHFNIILFDDLVDIDHAHSKSKRDKLWDWFRHVAMPTLDVLSEETRAHIIGTRYHRHDLYGRLIKRIEEGQSEWQVFVQPAMLPDGTSFWPEKFDVSFLQSIRRDYGDDVFMLQYQNDSTFLSGGYADEVDFTDVKVIPDDKDLSKFERFMGVDLATSSTRVNPRKACFAVVIIAFDRERKLVMVDKTYRKKVVRLPDQKELVYHFYREFTPELINIESNAYQSVFIDYLDEGGDELLPITTIYSSTAKEVHHEQIMSLVRRGKILFRESATDDLISELISFPDTTFDLGDASSFALKACKPGPRLTLF